MQRTLIWSAEGQADSTQGVKSCPNCVDYGHLITMSMSYQNLRGHLQRRRRWLRVWSIVGNGPGKNVSTRIKWCHLIECEVGNTDLQSNGQSTWTWGKTSRTNRKRQRVPSPTSSRPWLTASWGTCYSGRVLLSFLKKDIRPGTWKLLSRLDSSFQGEFGSWPNNTMLYWRNSARVLGRNLNSNSLICFNVANLDCDLQGW